MAEATDDRLRLLIERIERLEEEKKGTADDIRDVYAEAKAVGYDPKIMRQIVRLRKMKPDDRSEHGNGARHVQECARLGLIASDAGARLRLVSQLLCYRSNTSDSGGNSCPDHGRTHSGRYDRNHHQRRWMVARRQQYHGIVTGEVIVGANLFRDLFASIYAISLAGVQGQI